LHITAGDSKKSPRRPYPISHIDPSDLSLELEQPALSTENWASIPPRAKLALRAGFGFGGMPLHNRADLVSGALVETRLRAPAGGTF